MFCRVLSMPLNTSVMYLLNNHLCALESIEINECIGRKRVMSRLHIPVFIAFSFLSMVFQARRQFFYFLHYILSSILQIFPLSRINAVSFSKCGKQILFYWRCTLSIQQQPSSEAHLESIQASMTKIFSKIGNGFKLLTFFVQNLHE